MRSLLPPDVAVRIVVEDVSLGVGDDEAVPQLHCGADFLLITAKHEYPLYFALGEVYLPCVLPGDYPDGLLPLNVELMDSHYFLILGHLEVV